MQDKNKILVVSFQSLSANSGEGMARLGYYLSAELHKHGMLDQFIVSSKGKFETPFPSSPVSPLSRYYLFILNRLNKLLKIENHRFRFIQELLFDWFCSFRLSAGTTALVTTNSYLYRTFKKAKKKGIRIYAIPANPEDNYIYKLVKEEQDKLNIHFTDAYTYKTRLNYYNRSLALVDTVIGTFPTTYESYLKVHGNSKVVNIPGHLKPDFKPANIQPRPANNEYHACYLAYTVLLKGLQYLLKAWADIMAQPGTENMYLHIGGKLDGLMDGYIRKNHSQIRNVIYEGHISDVPSFVKDKDILIVPSIIEGGPVTALEAAHYGVPVIITRNCGSRDFFEHENSGWVIPIRDAAAIEDKIMFAYNNRDTAKQAGSNAKKKLDSYTTDSLIKAITQYLVKPE